MCKTLPQPTRSTMTFLDNVVLNQSCISHCLPAVVTNLLQQVELLSWTSSTSHLEYFYVNHDCARSAAEPPQNATTLQKSMSFTHMQNLATTHTFHNEFSGPRGAQPKSHYTFNYRHKKFQPKRNCAIQMMAKQVAKKYK